MADIENFVKIEPNKWKCLYCNNCHISKTNVKRHIETVHLRSKIYSCSFCPKKFGQKVEVKKHMQRIHESEKLFAIHKLYVTQSVHRPLKRRRTARKCPTLSRAGLW